MDSQTRSLASMSDWARQAQVQLLCISSQCWARSLLAPCTAQSLVRPSASLGWARLARSAPILKVYTWPDGTETVQTNPTMYDGTPELCRWPRNSHAPPEEIRSVDVPETPPLRL